MAIELNGLGHINIVVEDVAEASAFYEELFGAVPVQEFVHFRNPGFGRGAGFLDEPGAVDVTVRFVLIPGASLFLELMAYTNPVGATEIPEFATNDRGGPRHVCLRVKDVDAAFATVKATPGVRLINESPDYKPARIDPITPDQFTFLDPAMEADAAAKAEAAEQVGEISYFYFVDPYGVQWELEQGHDDIGADATE